MNCLVEWLLLFGFLASLENRVLLLPFFLCADPFFIRVNTVFDYSPGCCWNLTESRWFAFVFELTRPAFGIFMSVLFTQKSKMKMKIQETYFPKIFCFSLDNFIDNLTNFFVILVSSLVTQRAMMERSIQQSLVVFLFFNLKLTVDLSPCPARCRGDISWVSINSYNIAIVMMKLIQVFGWRIFIAGWSLF